MAEKSEVLHPRPQLTRPLWLDLRGAWDFTYDDDGQGIDEGWYERSDVYTRVIQVPFPPESSVSGIGDSSFHPVMWYRRTFQVPSEYAGKRLMLHCGAVDYRASVWVNGQHVISHEGGQTPFSADITSALHSNSDQVIVIRAEDMPQDMAQPRGKQDWHEHPHSIWYHRTSGIWQPVWIEPVAPTHITGVRWTPDLEREALGLSIELQRRDHAPVRVRVKLSMRGDVIADDVYAVQGTEVQRKISLNQGGIMDMDRLAWSPDHPNLVDATITLIEGETGYEVIDEVQSYAGLRSVSIADGRFLLNGRPYYLRMALEQGYWPETHLAAPGDEDLRREVELAKSLGFNGVRIHQKVEDPRFLYWCDRLGLLVWGEMASAYVFSHVAMERLTREWLDVLARDYSHPCIVAWVPLNESWGVPDLSRDAAQRHFVQTLYHLTKAFDQTRPVIGNDGWEHLLSDIYSVHDYTFDAQTLLERYGTLEAVERTLCEGKVASHALTLPGSRHTSEPIMLSEFGGISYRPDPGVPWFGYGTVANSDDFLDSYRKLVDAILESPVIAGFCYTQLTDTEQETNGLLTSHREPKLDPALVRAITGRSSAAIPAEVV